MVWRRTSPLSAQLQQISEVVYLSAGKARERHKSRTSPRTPRT
jgi:LysR family hydrogen peroxide-inducible transcriptional activator